MNKDIDKKAFFEKLKNIEIFSKIKDNTRYIEDFFNLCKIEEFLESEFIIRDGEEGDCLYILIQGEVKITKKTLQGDPYVVATLNDSFNVYFGELALLDKDTRSASVIATNDVITLKITRNDFLKYCESNYEFGFKVLFEIVKKLSKTVRKTNNDVLALFGALVDEIDNSI